jgi:2'-5' RNA ligase
MDYKLIRTFIAVPFPEALPINLKIQRIGCFFKVVRSRVMWTGIKGELNSLNKLVDKIQNNLDQLEIPKKNKPFHPHITLGRAKDLKKTPNISTFLNISYDPIPFRIEKVRFISSELFPNGPVYTILSTHFFGNN